MPRKPARRRQLLKSQPLTFSHFAHSVALVASIYKVKRQMHSSRLHRKIPPSFSGNGFVNHAMEDKSEQLESSDEEGFEGVVQADFAFFDPKPDDFHGVKLLLQTYLDDKHWDLSSLVDLILGQTTVGTVIKIEEDEDDGVYAVLTALNLGRYKCDGVSDKLVIGAIVKLTKAAKEPRCSWTARARLV